MGAIYSGNVHRSSNRSSAVRLMALLLAVAAMVWWVGRFGAGELVTIVTGWFASI